MSSRLTLPGGRASVPKPPPPKPRPAPPPPPAAKAEPKRTPEQVEAAQREAAARHHYDRLDEAGRAAAELVLAGGTVRASRARHDLPKNRRPGRHLLRWAQLTGRYVSITGKLWGNPYRPWRDEGRRPTDAELAASHALYRAHVLASPELMARLPGLRGRLIACACPPDSSCHGDVLIELLAEDEA